MMDRRLPGLLLAGLALLPDGALAIDPGTARGTITIDGRVIEVAHSAVVLKKDDEGLLDRDPELRIFVSDREIGNDALAGIVYLPVEYLAEKGQVAGLLVRVQPDDMQTAHVSVHVSGTDVLSLPAGEGLRKLSHSDTRVGGTLAGSAGPLEFSITFSAPLFHEPEITGEVKGRAARGSPQIIAVRKRARALAHGDLDHLLALCTPRARDRLKALAANPDWNDASKRAKAAEQLEKEAMKVRRIVIRGPRAVAIFGKDRWMSFEMVDGEWLVDD